MLKKVNYQDKNQSTYLCDCCDKELTGDKVYRLYQSLPSVIGQPKLFDLCEKCYKDMVNSIEERKESRSGEPK